MIFTLYCRLTSYLLSFPLFIYQNIDLFVPLVSDLSSLWIVGYELLELVHWFITRSLSNVIFQHGQCLALGLLWAELLLLVATNLFVLVGWAGVVEFLLEQFVVA